MNLGLYVLRGKLAVPTDDVTEWYRSLQDNVVAVDQLGDYTVSTVFLGVDHGYKEPLLFETMIFGGGLRIGYQERCATWEEAIEMHEKAMAEAMALMERER